MMNTGRDNILSMHTCICIWLTLLYIICITLVIFSLTTYQLQHRIYSTLQNPTDINVSLKYHECEPTSFQEAREARSNATGDGLKRFRCIPLQSYKGESFSPGSLLQHFDKIKEKAKVLKDNTKKLESFKLGAANMSEEIKKMEEQVKLDSRAYEMSISQSAHLTGVYTDIETYEKIFGAIGLPKLWTLPENILIVFLIFAMGTLGSLIFLTMEFLRQGDNAIEKFSNYFFRPLLGMVMALAVFVMFRSGQYSMGIESAEHLSPFFISFMSIISGMMSEKVYGSLKLQGEKILPNENNENNEITKS